MAWIGLSDALGWSLSLSRLIHSIGVILSSGWLSVHLIGRTLTSGFCADDSAGSEPLMQKMYIFQKVTDLQT